LSGRRRLGVERRPSSDWLTKKNCKQSYLAEGRHRHSDGVPHPVLICEMLSAPATICGRTPPPANPHMVVFPKGGPTKLLFKEKGMMGGREGGREGVSQHPLKSAREPLPSQHAGLPPPLQGYPTLRLATR